MESNGANGNGEFRGKTDIRLERLEEDVAELKRVTHDIEKTIWKATGAVGLLVAALDVVLRFLK